MANLLKFKRGPRATLPVLNQGEPAFTTDLHELWVGDGSNNYLVGAPDIFRKTVGGVISADTTHSGNTVHSGNILLTGTATLTLANDPTSAMQAATKQYVDNNLQGLKDFKQACRVATTANLSATYVGSPTFTLTATANGAISIDGIALSVNDRVLVKDQATSTQNGIYVVTTVGNGGAPWVLTRSSDFNSSAQILSGAYAFISDGTVNIDTAWVLTTKDPITLDTTGLTFVLFSGLGQITAGNGLTKSGNTLSVSNGNGVTFDSSSRVSVQTVSASRIAVGAGGVDLATTGVSAGTYTKLTVDIYGRTTAGATATLDDINDGATYGRVLNTQLTGNRVNQIYDGVDTLVPSGTTKASHYIGGSADNLRINKVSASQMSILTGASTLADFYANSFFVGNNVAANQLSTASQGASSTTMYIGNQSILVSNSVIDCGTWV